MTYIYIYIYIYIYMYMYMYIYIYICRNVQAGAAPGYNMITQLQYDYSITI